MIIKKNIKTKRFFNEMNIKLMRNVDFKRIIDLKLINLFTKILINSAIVKEKK